MFSINDIVLYGSEGACRIISIAPRDLGAGMREYYILQPVYRKDATVFVPVGSEKLVARMRRALDAGEIDRIITEMPGEESVWIESEAERKLAYREIMAEGDSRGLVRLIKGLYLHQKEQTARGRRLHLADERAFKEAERLLYDQFALALDIRPEEVLPYIIRKIEGKK